MIDYAALSLNSTGALTRVYTAVVDAGPERGTLSMDHTFRTTGRCGTHIPRLTRTLVLLVDLTAHCIWPTGVPSTWGAGGLGRHMRFNTTDEGVTGEVFGAVADGVVVDDFTLGSNPTHSWARVHTLLPEAGQVLWAL